MDRIVGNVPHLPPLSELQGTLDGLLQHGGTMPTTLLLDIASRLNHPSVPDLVQHMQQNHGGTDMDIEVRASDPSTDRRATAFDVLTSERGRAWRQVLTTLDIPGEVLGPGQLEVLLYLL